MQILADEADHELVVVGIDAMTREAHVGRELLLSVRDAERGVLTEGVGFAVLNLMSDNPGMRWDIDTTRGAIGYAPRDGAVPDLSDAMRAREVEVAQLQAESQALRARAAEYDS